MDIRPFIGKVANRISQALLLVSGLALVPAGGMGMTILWEYCAGKSVSDDSAVTAGLLTLVVLLGLYALLFAPRVVRATFFADWVYAKPKPKRKAKPFDERKVRDRQRTILLAFGAAFIPVIALFVSGCWGELYHGKALVDFGPYAGLLAGIVVTGFYAFLYVPAVRQGKIAFTPRVRMPAEVEWDAVLTPDPAPQPARHRRTNSARRSYEPVVQQNNAFHDDDCLEWYK